MTKKEKKAAYDKKWWEANREKNKEKLNAYAKAHYEANKEKLNTQRKALYESQKDGLFTVYLLVNDNYVGQTNNLHNRLKAHKNTHRRNISNVQIIGKYKTREQAKEIEAGYHARGYSGYYRGN